MNPGTWGLAKPWAQLGEWRVGSPPWRLEIRKLRNCRVCIHSTHVGHCGLLFGAVINGLVDIVHACLLVDLTLISIRCKNGFLRYLHVHNPIISPHFVMKNFEPTENWKELFNELYIWSTWVPPPTFFSALSALYPSAHPSTHPLFYLLLLI